MPTHRSAVVALITLSLATLTASAHADVEVTTAPPPLPHADAAASPAPAAPRAAATTSPASPYAPPSPQAPTTSPASPYAPPSPQMVPYREAPGRAPGVDPSAPTAAANEPASADRPATADAARSPDDYSLLHGFRLGYSYVMNYDAPTGAFDGKSLKEKVGLRSPHHFLIGYEVMYRVVGHSWLNVLLLGNVMIAGLEQSKVLPSANGLIGFELNNTFQLGVGANLSPLKGSEGHTIIAAGWTPRIGSIYTPVHFFFIPDVDSVNRFGLTTGVTF